MSRICTNLSRMINISRKSASRYGIIQFTETFNNCLVASSSTDSKEYQTQQQQNIKPRTVKFSHSKSRDISDDAFDLQAHQNQFNSKDDHVGSYNNHKSINQQSARPSTKTEYSSQQEKGHPMSAREKLKLAVKVYGSTVVVFHVTISLVSLGGFYLMVSSGLDMHAIMTKLGINEDFSSQKLTASSSTFVVAYAIHKVFAPARIGVTVSVTPFIVKYLRKTGFLKKPN